GFSLYHSLSLLKNSNYSNTLKTIIFCKINFKNISMNEVFERLNVLESIHILYCYPLNFQQITNLTKPFKLKSLFMDGSINIVSLQLLLQKNGEYLENIGLDSEMDNKLKQKLFIMIKNYCK